MHPPNLFTFLRHVCRMETLKKHLPVSVPEGLNELQKIAVRFEEKIYTAATNQVIQPIFTTSRSRARISYGFFLLVVNNSRADLSTIGVIFVYIMSECL